MMTILMYFFQLRITINAEQISDHFERSKAHLWSLDAATGHWFNEGSMVVCWQPFTFYYIFFCLIL